MRAMKNNFLSMISPLSLAYEKTEAACLGCSFLMKGLWNRFASACRVLRVTSNSKNSIPSKSPVFDTSTKTAGENSIVLEQIPSLKRTYISLLIGSMSMCGSFFISVINCHQLKRVCGLYKNYIDSTFTNCHPSTSAREFLSRHFNITAFSSQNSLYFAFLNATLRHSSEYIRRITNNFHYQTRVAV